MRTPAELSRPVFPPAHHTWATKRSSPFSSSIPFLLPLGTYPAHPICRPACLKGKPQLRSSLLYLPHLTSFWILSTFDSKMILILVCSFWVPSLPLLQPSSSLSRLRPHTPPQPVGLVLHLSLHLSGAAFPRHKADRVILHTQKLPVVSHCP